jgi:Alpha/beta hydrolase domain
MAFITPEICGTSVLVDWYVKLARVAEGYSRYEKDQPHDLLQIRADLDRSTRSSHRRFVGLRPRLRQGHPFGATAAARRYPLSDLRPQGRHGRQRHRAVPVATYTGWALRTDGLDGCDAAGQKIAFARTKAERLAAGDPRPSLEERYVDHGAYVSAVTRAAQTLEAERFLLDEDAAAATAAAQASSVP